MSRSHPSDQKMVEVTARHRIKATLEQVFDGWVVPKLVESWWGPDGFSVVVRELDAKVGGAFVFEMMNPEGKSCFMTGSYLQVQRPHLLVMEVADHCNIALPDHVEPQLEAALLTVEFRRIGKQTEVAVTHAQLKPSYSVLAQASWLSALAKLSKVAINQSGVERDGQ